MGSVGSDGSVATTIDFKFNILNPGPIKLYIRCITKGFVFNGFEVTKFFAGPSKDDTTLILDCGPSEKATENVFMNPTLWTERFSRDYDIRPFSAPDYNSHPRLLADVDGDGDADIVLIAPDGVYG